MTPVEQALEEAARAFGVGCTCPECLARTRPVIAAFLRSIASAPTPEMVEAGRAADNDAELAAQFSVSHNIWRAMASALADQVEDRHG